MMQFYAPDLETAFGLCRARYPIATGWRCYGATEAGPNGWRYFTMGPA
jgi:hypothetical protein